MDLVITALIFFELCYRIITTGIHYTLPSGRVPGAASKNTGEGMCSAASRYFTFIPYRDYNRLLGIVSIDEHIRYGGTLRLGELDFNDNHVNTQDASFRNDVSARRYSDTMICRNIQYSLARYVVGRHFRHLYALYEAEELTGGINRIIEDMNHWFLISVFINDFRSHDLRLAAANLRKEWDPEKCTDALDRVDTRTVSRRLVELSDIRNKEEQSIGITPAHIAEIKQYLSTLELIVDCPIETSEVLSGDYYL